MAEFGYRIGSLARSHENTMSLFVLLLVAVIHEEPCKRFICHVLKFYDIKLKVLSTILQQYS